VEPIDAVWKRWQETHAALLDCVEQFPEEGLQWQPAPHATPAASILVHVALAECCYASVIDPQAVIPAALAYGRRGGPEAAERRDAHVRSLVDRSAAVALVETAADFATGVVEQLAEADLERVVAQEWFPLGPRVEGPLTTLWFIEQMSRHKAYHLGQLWYLEMLLDA
jgi:DinB superfamily